MNDILLDVAARFKREADVTEESLTYLEVMAWLGESYTKLELAADAADHPVFFMCLGADLEFIIFDPNETREERRRAQAAKNKQIKQFQLDQLRKQRGIQQAEDELNPVTEAGVGVEIWPEPDENEPGPEAAPTVATTIATKKGKKNGDLLRIKLTHGSVLMVSGWDAEVRFAFIRWIVGRSGL